MSVKKKVRLLFYDIEVFKHDWIVVIIDYKSGKRCEIANDRNMLSRIYTRFKDAIWVGYNNRHYDQYIFKALLLNMNPKEINDKLINENIKGYQISKKFKNIQMYNYDCMLLGKGLKQLEGFMGESIEETSVDFNIDRKLTDNELKDSISYCVHDVEQTIKVFNETKQEFDAHLGMITEFKLDMDCFSKTKAQLSAQVLGAERLHGIDDELEYEFMNTLSLDKYKYIQEWFDKNRFYHIKHDNKKDTPNKLKTDVMGLSTTFGFGGVHSALTKYKSEGFLVHSDVRSYYPTAMVLYDLLSRAVKEPIKYKNVLGTRVYYKMLGDPRQAPYKIILNSTFGIAKDKNSAMYDPKKANEICINCQLFLVDLVEKLEKELGDNIINVQLNTDGIIMKLTDKSYFDKYVEICEEWQKRTGFELEHDLIKRIIQKDVNNYLFEFESGKIERKGAYVKKLSKIDYNLSIVNKAVVEYLLHDVPVEETINNCDDLIEFQQISKIGSTYKYIMYGDKPIKEKIIRTFACTKDLPGVWKIKDKVDKDTGEIKETPEKIANTPEKCFIDNTNIVGKKCPEYLDKQFYINMAKKRIRDFIGKDAI